MSSSSEFDARLAAAGIASSYTDGLGRFRQVPRSTLQRVLALLASEPSAPTPLASPSAGSCYIPEPLTQGERLWGLGVQLYALRSARNWGIGDFTDLRMLGLAAAEVGADFLAVNPLHARSLAVPELCSPYSPSSRLFLDPLYIDPEAVVDFAESPELNREIERPQWRKQIEHLRSLELVDYTSVCRIKLDVFRQLYRHFRDRHLERGTPRAHAFTQFKKERDGLLDHYARFEAHRLASTLAEHADPEELAELHCYVQWVAEIQLEHVASTLQRSGMRIGLYRDLALGPDRSGSEADDPAACLLNEVSAGAPPDAFNPHGQFWNLAVYDPHALTAQSGRPFADLLTANMRHAGALRIDHVMNLQRLFWIIDNDALHGAYVNYPLQLLSSVLADRSRAMQCLVVGEDLGTLPAGFREAMRSLRALGCHVLWFERDAEGRFHAPSAYSRTSVVSATTHDLPTINGFWTGCDIELRQALGLFATDADYVRALTERRSARAALAAALANDRIDATHIAEGVAPPGLSAAVHAHLARTPAMFLQVQLDDVLESLDAVNLPGSNDRQNPNWRRKLPVRVECLGDDSRFSALADLDRSGGD